jgi:hypothetical protein
MRARAGGDFIQRRSQLRLGQTRLARERPQPNVDENVNALPLENRNHVRCGLMTPSRLTNAELMIGCIVVLLFVSRDGVVVRAHR